MDVFVPVWNERLGSYNYRIGDRLLAVTGTRSDQAATDALALSDEASGLQCSMQKSRRSLDAISYSIFRLRTLLYSLNSGDTHIANAGDISHTATFLNRAHGISLLRVFQFRFWAKPHHLCRA